MITIIAVGKNMPSWVSAGIEEYTHRMPSDYKVQFIEVSLEKRGKNVDLAKVSAIEEQKITAQIPKNAICIALDRIGKTVDTQYLAKQLQGWHDDSQSVCFIIGGPEGLSEGFLKKANQLWSLSAMTLPHPLVRVVMAEQLYRAWSIIVKHPYHR